ncbi:glycine betaine ABC transporter substrate-binding protein [Cupriavidus sp. 2TAF22]|uniref:taurine ABC transporter substrate-binding protein n=1 Tax=unclassified Cupriavidus TaxID=2640874 RepID=UPI003F90C710
MLDSLKAVIAASLAAGMFGAHAQSAIPQEVRVAYSGGAQLIVNAKVDHSLEKAFGTKVKWIQFATGADVLNLFATKSIDIANFGSSPTVSAVIRKLPIEIVGVSAEIATYERLVGRDSIKTLKDLEGKTVGYPPNSTAQYALDTAVKVHGIDRTKIKFVPLRPDELVAAWRRGDIDAGYVWAPFNSALEDAGGHAVFATKDLKKDGYLIYNNYAVSKDFASKYPELVAKLLTVHEQQIAIYRKTPEVVAEAISKELGASVPAVRNSLAGNQYPSITEQLTPAWFGDGSNTDSAGLSLAVRRTAEFLADIEQVKRQDIPSSFASSIKPTYLRLAQQQVR